MTWKGVEKERIGKAPQMIQDEKMTTPTNNFKLSGRVCTADSYWLVHIEKIT